MAFSRLEVEIKKCLISPKDSVRDNSLSSSYVYFLNNVFESVILFILYSQIII